MFTRGAIEDILRRELERAAQHHEEMKVEFWRVSGKIPSGLPHPDGTQRIQKAGNAQRVAMQARYLALRRLDLFLTDGTIPDDLNG